ncbi:hypothetical protein [Chromobacterium subtsugae]|uniref:hypothetical protein n=1 Tax=Chromobacterium subtsugae TaxID=251747 RepID=UPI001F1AC4BE|nr:hypothetical protein [Chromobacterium subtsugae]
MLAIDTSDAAIVSFVPYLKLLARLTEGALMAKLPEDDAPVAMSGKARLMLKLEVDKAAETARLTIGAGQGGGRTGQAGEPGYVDKAPAHLVGRGKEQVAEFIDKLEKIRARLVRLA